MSRPARAAVQLPERTQSGRRTQDAIARAIERLAAAPRVYVMCDFDGTIAAIRHDPQRVVPDPTAMTALKDLAALPRTSVSVISGRSLDDLRMRVREPGQLKLIGSYGIEADGGRSGHGPAHQQAQRLVDRIERTLSRAVGSLPGVRIERKTLSVAMHFRGLPRSEARRACTRASRAMATSGLRAVAGRSVAEWCAFTPCKASAIRKMVDRRARQCVLCIGDDHGDAGALAMVHAWGGVAISVGRRRAGIPLRVRGVPDVARVLRRLSELRTAHVPSSSAHLASPRGRNARVAKARARAHGRSGAASARA